MPSFAATARITASPKTVWQFLTDLDRASQWISGAGRTELLTPGPLAVGTQFNQTRTVLGKTETREIEVIQFEPLRLYAIGSKVPGGVVSYRYGLKPVDEDTTEIHLLVEAVGSGLVFRAFATAAIAVIRGVDGDQLQRLKAAIERPSP